MKRDNYHISSMNSFKGHCHCVGFSLGLFLPISFFHSLVFYYLLTCAATAAGSLPGIEYSYGISPKFVCTPVPPEADPSCYSPPSMSHGPNGNTHANDHRGMMSDDAKATILHLRESLVRQKETILDQRETIRELTAKLTLCEGFGGHHGTGSHDNHHDSHHDNHHDNHHDVHHQGQHGDPHGHHGSHSGPSSLHHGSSTHNEHHNSHGSRRQDPHHRKGTTNTKHSPFSPEQTGKTLQTLKERLENLQARNSSSSYSSSLRELLQRKIAALEEQLHRYHRDPHSFDHHSDPHTDHHDDHHEDHHGSSHYDDHHDDHHDGHRGTGHHDDHHGSDHHGAGHHDDHHSSHGVHHGSHFGGSNHNRYHNHHGNHRYDHNYDWLHGRHYGHYGTHHDSHHDGYGGTHHNDHHVGDHHDDHHDHHDHHHDYGHHDDHHDDHHDNHHEVSHYDHHYDHDHLPQHLPYSSKGPNLHGAGHGKLETVLDQLHHGNDHGNKPKITSPSAFLLNFPMRSNHMYAKMKRSVVNEIFAMTLCLWLKSGEGSGLGTPISYAVPGQANELVLMEWGNNPMELLINDKAKTLPINIRDGKWHHVCVTWATRDGAWEAYQDGAKKGSGQNLSAWQSIKPGGVFILGQEQDTMGGRFDITQSFRGEMSDLQVWSRVLTENQIHTQATCGAHLVGDVLSWSEELVELHGGLTELPFEPCH